MPSAKTEWIALVYSVPATPTKGRVFVWRKLRALHAQALRPGMALLPNSKESLASFDALCKKIEGFSGDAVLLEMNFISPAENEAMRRRFACADEDALRATLRECTELVERMNKTADPTIRATIERTLDKKLSRFRKPPVDAMKRQTDELEQAVGTLFDTLRGLPAEFAAMLHIDK
ncbi:MAG TPA: Chromate resistance protein ChrB [Clostridia bacterium]|nr:Chromate resistance protein ChrB [Clostridia bacterium]